MSNRTLFWMTGIVILCIIALLLLNALPMIWTPPTEKYLKFNDVRGMAVEHKNKLYTLNFDQQTQVVGYLNQAVPVDNASVANKNPKIEISKIVVYRFDAPDLILIPIEYRNDNLIFSSPDWNKDGLMKDVSGGALQNILAQTYDP